MRKLAKSANRYECSLRPTGLQPGDLIPTPNRMESFARPVAGSMFCGVVVTGRDTWLHEVVWPTPDWSEDLCRSDIFLQDLRFGLRALLENVRC